MFEINQKLFKKNYIYNVIIARCYIGQVCGDSTWLDISVSLLRSLFGVVVPVSETVSLRSISCFSLRMMSSGLETDVGDDGPPLEQADEEDTL